jgi:SMI1/KNR4 family protein SUKH-1
MWHEMIAKIEPNAEFHPPATLEQLVAVEAALEVTLPVELKALLLETNGVEGQYGPAFVWSTDEILSRNLEMRADWRPGGWLEGYMPVDHLLFFGDLGNGDLVFFPITPDGVRSRVYRWDHEDDSRNWEASGLADWLRGQE